MVGVFDLVGPGPRFVPFVCRWPIPTSSGSGSCCCVWVCLWVHMELERKCREIHVEIYVCICGTRMAILWSWWGLGYLLRSTRTHTHAAQMLEAPLCDPLELEVPSHTWRRTTKASSCCWLCTSPAEPWESAAELVYSSHTVPSLSGLTPLCFTFFMNPTITFHKCNQWKLHSIFCNESLVMC